MREKVLHTFRQVYGKDPDYLVRAPGRANLIGEHTDYNDGFVMPLAVDRAVWIAFSGRGDSEIHLHSIDFDGQSITFTTDQLQDNSLPHWTKYVRGAWWILAQKGQLPSGAEMVIGGDIPLGAGMSSSAAIGVGVVEVGLVLLNDHAHSQADKALMAVEIEHKFIGTPCGVMDQMASAAAIDHSAMLLDCRSLETQPVPIPAGVSIVVLNTNKSRELADSAYGERRRQCEEAAQIIGVPALRDATLEMVEGQREALGDVRYRRARHVVTENSRTLEMVTTLKANNLSHAGELINASHASLRDDYEVSCFELDVMSELARQHPACYGARMMGGGFGGCAVALVKSAKVDALIESIRSPYMEQTGLTPEFYVCQPAAGSSVEKL